MDYFSQLDHAVRFVAQPEEVYLADRDQKDEGSNGMGKFVDHSSRREEEIVEPVSS